MELDVKQYLHYYIGQPVRYRYIDWEKDSWTPWCAMSIRDLEKIIDDMSLSMFEIQFRKLSSMTEDECYELEQIGRKSFINRLGVIEFQARQFHYLISKGFWLFGSEYFDAGLIIEKV